MPLKGAQGWDRAGLSVSGSKEAGKPQRIAHLLLCQAQIWRDAVWQAALLPPQLFDAISALTPAQRRATRLDTANRMQHPRGGQAARASGEAAPGRPEHSSGSARVGQQYALQAQDGFMMHNDRRGQLRVIIPAAGPWCGGFAIRV